MYTTEAIVLRSTPVGEVGKLLHLFTRDLGLLSARATGVRRVSSKLRYHLEPYTLATVSLVRGREVWRLTGARTSEQLLLPPIPLISRSCGARLLSLLERLVPREEVDSVLWDDFLSVLGLLSHTTLDRYAIRRVEIVTALRLLSRLGYLEFQEEFVPLVGEHVFTEVVSRTPETLLPRAVSAINRALRASSL